VGILAGAFLSCGWREQKRLTPIAGPIREDDLTVVVAQGL
jgi:hypothetical protein